jgi:hypothetical protein
MTIALETKIMGSKFSHEDMIELSLDHLAESITLKDLIREKVLVEIKAYNTNQREGYGLEYRSFEDLERDINKGEVNIKHEFIKDEEGEIRNAINCFKDGRYKVFLNGNELLSLEDKIPIDMDSKVMFLRLIPLTGG